MKAKVYLEAAKINIKSEVVVKEGGWCECTMNVGHRHRHRVLELRSNQIASARFNAVASHSGA